MPMPKEAAWLSKRVILPGNWLAANSADCRVPESLLEMWMERTWSASWRASAYALAKSSGEGWLVLGKASPERTLWKISSGVISSQSRYTRPPRFT